MTWLVFGVSCLLVLAGAVTIISGAPIVQIERGWTEVIAGTVALSSGGVVFALAAILMRLESVRDALAIPRPAAEVPASEDPATSPIIADTPVSIVLAPQPPQETGDVAEAPQAASSDSVTGQGLWKRVKRAGETAPDAGTLERGGFPDRLTSVVTPVPDPEPAIALTAPIAPAVAIDRATETDSAASEPSQLGWLERSLFKGRLPKAFPDERVPLAPEPARPVPLSLPAQIEGPRTEPALVVEPTHDSSPILSGSSEEYPEPAVTEAAGVTVIGRYQAGVASYVMYSDGTIEVETEGGQSHRFASMEELKAFIANQDNVLS